MARPAEAKVRSIKKANEKFAKAIWGVAGGPDLLRQVGFLDQGETVALPLEVDATPARLVRCASDSHMPSKRKQPSCSIPSHSSLPDRRTSMRVAQALAHVERSQKLTQDTRAGGSRSGGPRTAAEAGAYRHGWISPSPLSSPPAPRRPCHERYATDCAHVHARRRTMRFRRWQQEVHYCSRCDEIIHDGSERTWTGKFDAPIGQFRCASCDNPGAVHGHYCILYPPQRLPVPRRNKRESAKPTAARLFPLPRPPFPQVRVRVRVVCGIFLM